MPLQLCSCRLTDGFFSELAEASEKVVFHGKGHDISLFISHAMSGQLASALSGVDLLRSIFISKSEQTSMFFAVDHDTDCYTYFFSD